MRTSAITIMCLILYSRGGGGNYTEDIKSMIYRSKPGKSPSSPLLKALKIPKLTTFKNQNVHYRDIASQKIITPKYTLKLFRNNTQKDDIQFSKGAPNRNKREVIEPANKKSSEEIPEAEPLPEAESLTWVRPSRYTNPGVVRNFHSLPNNSPQMSIQDRYNHRRLDPTTVPSLSYRHNALLSNRDSLNRILNALLGEEQYTYSNSHGPPQSMNALTRQYIQNEYKNPNSYPTRFQDIPSQPQQNPYQVPSFPSRPTTGSSLLELLNPLNLFRPQIPRNPNPIPPLGYDPRQLTQAPRHPTTRAPKGGTRNSFRGSNNQEFDLTVDYEIVEEDFEHDYGHEYLKDSDLREDIYIGKDGNLYIRDNVTPGKGNSIKQNHYGENRRPSKRPSYPKLDRPAMPPPKNRYENEKPEGMDIYEDLLKNHNMNDERPVDIPTSEEDYFSDNFDNFDDFDSFDNYHTNSLADSHEYDDDLNWVGSIEYDDYEDDFNRLQNSRSHQSKPQTSDMWRPSNSRKINYPSYYLTPKLITFPGFRNRPRAWRPYMPPRSARPRLTSLRPKRPLLTRPPPLQTSAPKLSPTVASIPYVNLNTDYSYKDRRKNIRTQNPSILDSSRIYSEGFYPGNGFFDADFGTLFHMGSGMRERAYNNLPRALAQNGTTVPPSQKSSTEISHTKDMTTEDSPP